MTFPRLIRTHGHTYLAGERTFNVYRQDGDRWVLSAALIQEKPKKGQKGPAPIYFWHDANGNGKVDEEEYQGTPADCAAGGVEVLGPAVARRPVAGGRAAGRHRRLAPRPGRVRRARQPGLQAVAETPDRLRLRRPHRQNRRRDPWGQRDGQGVRQLLEPDRRHAAGRLLRLGRGGKGFTANFGAAETLSLHARRQGRLRHEVAHRPGGAAATLRGRAKSTAPSTSAGRSTGSSA